MEAPVMKKVTEEEQNYGRKYQKLRIPDKKLEQLKMLYLKYDPDYKNQHKAPWR